MKFIHKLTHETLDVKSKLGGDWVPFDDFEVEKVKATDATAEIVENETTTTTTASDDGANAMTIAEIKQELDAFGIKYNPKAKKAELYALMMEGA